MGMYSLPANSWISHNTTKPRRIGNAFDILKGLQEYRYPGSPWYKLGPIRTSHSYFDTPMVRNVHLDVLYRPIPPAEVAAIQAYQQANKNKPTVFYLR